MASIDMHCREEVMVMLRKQVVCVKVMCVKCVAWNKGKSVKSAALYIHLGAEGEEEGNNDVMCPNLEEH